LALVGSAAGLLKLSLRSDLRCFELSDGFTSSCTWRLYNRFLVAQLGLVYPFAGLFATASLAVEGRGLVALDEHQEIVTAIKESDGEAA